MSVLRPTADYVLVLQQATDDWKTRAGALRMIERAILLDRVQARLDPEFAATSQLQVNANLKGPREQQQIDVVGAHTRSGLEARAEVRAAALNVLRMLTLTLNKVQSDAGNYPDPPTRGTRLDLDT